MDKTSFLNKIKEMGFNYLRISLTKDCNGACSFCHNEGQEIGKRGDKSFSHLSLMSLDQYVYIARFFKEILESVSLTGGEPTLVKNLPEIIQLFKAEGYHVRMTTNAFLLNNEMQLRLKHAGLDAINVSLSSLNSKQHAKMFNTLEILTDVIRNLENLVKNFPNKVKINFMALDGVNVPTQLIPITQLAGRLGLTISFLTTLENDSSVSENVLSHLKNNFVMNDIKEVESKFGKKTLYTFSNGAKWEFDDFRQYQYRKAAFNNSECQICPEKDNCVEGPYAMRISHNGLIRPCLIRNDNTIPLTNSGYFDEKTEE